MGEEMVDALIVSEAARGIVTHFTRVHIDLLSILPFTECIDNNLTPLIHV